VAYQTVSPDLLQIPGARVSRTSARWSIVWAGERIVALVLFLLMLPVMVAAGIVVVLLSRRSPLISHSRLGCGGRALQVLKLRTMWEQTNLPWKLRFAERVVTHLSPEPKDSSDCRISSRFARLLRRFSIDELPQLWQVVRGDMALIGPRPVTFEEMAVYYGGDAGEVLSMKPGMTGLWQVRGRSRLSYRRRRRLDLFLVRRLSLRLYLFIVISTLHRVVLGKDSW
jgi:lipopolysaccharide/colanic/teichoic acid biosynthesis glycosyltransferase